MSFPHSDAHSKHTPPPTPQVQNSETKFCLEEKRKKFPELVIHVVTFNSICRLDSRQLTSISSEINQADVVKICKWYKFNSSASGLPEPVVLSIDSFMKRGVSVGE